MSARTRKLHQLGFTLLELIIVIFVIMILSLIVVGRMLSATRRAKEARLVEDLRQLRTAITLFENDTGVYPGELTDIVAKSQDNLSATLSYDARAQYQGPYLSTTGGGLQLPDYAGLPTNPYVSPVNRDVSAHWTYDDATGTVICATDGVSLDGVPYSEL